MCALSNKPNSIIISYSTFVMHNESISCTKISLKGYHILAWNFFFWLVFVKVLDFGNFGSHYFHENQIFDKQQGELSYLQYPWSVVYKKLITHFCTLEWVIGVSNETSCKLFMFCTRLFACSLTMYLWN